MCTTRTLMRRIVLALLALSLLLPSLAFAADFSARLEALTDDELLELKAAVDQEAEARGLLAENASAKRSGSGKIYVWCTTSGKKYHSVSTCSNMKKPIQTTLTDAKEHGLKPCTNCDPPR